MTTCTGRLPPCSSSTGRAPAAEMAYMLPHLRSGWAVDQAILNEEDRVVVIRFGHDADDVCMLQDESLYAIADTIKAFAVIYLVRTPPRWRTRVRWACYLWGGLASGLLVVLGVVVVVVRLLCAFVCVWGHVVHACVRACRYVFVCLCVCLCVCMSAYLSACLYVCLCACLSVLSVCLSVCLSVGLLVSLSVSLLVCAYICCVGALHNRMCGSRLLAPVCLPCA